MQLGTSNFGRLNPLDHSLAKTLVSIEDDGELHEILSYYTQGFASVSCSHWLSVGTSISPWIVTLEALEPFKCEPIKQVIFNTCGEMLSGLS